MEAKIKEYLIGIGNPEVDADNMASDIVRIINNLQPEQTWKKCDTCGCTPSAVIITEFGSFCKAHAKYVE